MANIPIKNRNVLDGKNMDNIEKVMSDSYKLFEMINLNEDKDSWADRAVSIARDIHEIKKKILWLFVG